MEPAEVNLARRLIKKYKLTPPIDVRALVAQYARITFVPFPLLNVDGVSIDIKVPGKRPHVLVNSLQPDARQTFTIAHELGHLLIPWHIGTILDQVDAHVEEKNDYWEMEREANAFAAELLMPKEWIEGLLRNAADPASVHVQLCRAAGVSAHAAGIRLMEIVPPHYVYCVEQDGLVAYAGRSNGTFASAPSCNSPLPETAYNYSLNHYSAGYSGRQFHWWELPDKLNVKRTDSREWREILNNIATDLDYRGERAVKIKSQINAVVAYANSATKRLPNYGVETIAGAAMQRLQDRYKGEFEDFLAHKDFELFLKKRAEDLVGNVK
jgi:Zn-dependent peptidase ImmA (M78 family)